MCMLKCETVKETEKRGSTLAEILTERISSQLCTHNWSLKMLSDKSGVPYETIKKIANGKIDNPSLRSTMKIASAFGCSIDYLAGHELSERHFINNRCTDAHSYLNSL